MCLLRKMINNLSWVALCVNENIKTEHHLKEILKTWHARFRASSGVATSLPNPFEILTIFSTNSSLVFANTSLEYADVILQSNRW